MSQEIRNIYHVDDPEIYTASEISELIAEYGIETAIRRMDLSKVSDKKLKSWLEQFEKLVERIESRLIPAKVTING